MPQCCTLAHGVLLVLSTIGMFNFIDRGIITGAPKEFGHFVTCTLGVSSSQQSVFLGLMTSFFVVGYSIASVVFGHAVHHFPKFRLLCVGLVIWVFALFLSGLAHWLPAAPGTFWFFIFARALSGVGEAAFQCIVPPYIEDFAPAASKSLWLSLFYTAIPTGTALGYLYGAAMAETSAGWGAAYLIEAVLMAPLALLTLRLPSAETLVARLEAAGTATKPASQALLPESGGGGGVGVARGSPEWLTLEEQLPSLEPLPPIMPLAPMPIGSVGGGGARATGSGGLPSPTPTDGSISRIVADDAGVAPLEGEGHGYSLLEQLRYVLGMPSFVLLVVGYAAFTGTTIGISSFGPLFMIALGLEAQEVEAASLFGLCVALAGMFGTPIGGLLTDAVSSKRQRANEAEGLPPAVANLREAQAIVKVIFWQIAVGALLLILCAATVGSARSKPLFLLLLFGGVFFTFGSSAGITRAIMLLVPPPMRSFAIALSVLGIHAGGDVPSPIIVGGLKDTWAPQCGIVWLNDTHGCGNEDGKDQLDPACAGSQSSQDGLVDVLLVATLWMIISVVTWGLAIPALERQIRATTRTLPSNARR